MIKLLDGKALSEKIYEEAKETVVQLNYVPNLTVISVGNDSASKVYIRNKKRACEKCGIRFDHIDLNNIDGLSDEDLMSTLITFILDLNKNPDVDGILVQKPLPFKDKTLEDTVIKMIDPSKDVDVFSAESIYALYSYKDNKILSCTPKGIIRLLDEYKIPIEGKEIVIIGRSNIVGKPLALALLNRNATVTVCHSKTKNLKEITKRADILISAIGRAKMINKNYIGENCKVIIDVGMNRDTEGKLCGDVDFESVKQSSFSTYYTTYITPVPGGVGPMTVASLIENLLQLSEVRRGVIDIQRTIFEYDIRSTKDLSELLKEDIKDE